MKGAQILSGIASGITSGIGYVVKGGGYAASTIIDTVGKIDLKDTPKLNTFSTKNLMVSEKKSVDILKQNNKVTLSLFMGAIICFFAFILPAIFPIFIIVLFCFICYLFAKDNYKKYFN